MQLKTETKKEKKTVTEVVAAKKSENNVEISKP